MRGRRRPPRAWLTTTRECSPPPTTTTGGCRSRSSRCPGGTSSPTRWTRYGSSRCNRCWTSSRTDVGRSRTSAGAPPTRPRAASAGPTSAGCSRRWTVVCRSCSCCSRGPTTISATCPTSWPPSSVGCSWRSAPRCRNCRRSSVPMSAATATAALTCMSSSSVGRLGSAVPGQPAAGLGGEPAQAAAGGGRRQRLVRRSAAGRGIRRRRGGARAAPRADPVTPPTRRAGAWGAGLADH